MLARTVSEIIGTDRDVAGDGWRSRRLVLAGEGLPYSFHETILDAGVCLRFAYRTHRETVYCIDGEGEVEDVASGNRWPLRPGSLYSVSIGDDHIVTTRVETRLICIFDPPLAGQEEAE
jgi:L-ectoine synthase